MRRAAILLGALLAVSLAGCAQQGPAPVSPGNGPWQEWQHSPFPAVSFSGPTLDGGRFSSSAYAGKVLVVNFWFASCGPCKAESPDLASVVKKFAGQPVQFVGVNVRDAAGEATPFVQQFKVAYPVILDQQDSNAVQLAFAASVPPTTTPTTVVIGKRGRVTGSMIGEADPDILTTLIQAAVSGRDS